MQVRLCTSFEGIVPFVVAVWELEDCYDVLFPASKANGPSPADLGGRVGRGSPHQALHCSWQGWVGR